ncbi:hypothetical protein Hanom_Chr12g01068611 [Helianthus anomalus]
MTNLPFPLKGQTTGTIRVSSTFLEKNPTTTLHLNLHPPSPSSTLHYHHCIQQPPSPNPSTKPHHHHHHPCVNCIFIK